jgi:hypothetical protein
MTTFTTTERTYGLFVPKAERHAHSLRRYRVYLLITVHWSPASVRPRPDGLSPSLSLMLHDPHAAAAIVAVIVAVGDIAWEPAPLTLPSAAPVQSYGDRRVLRFAPMETPSKTLPTRART